MAIGRGRVVTRGTTLWLDYDDEQGKRRRQSTGLRVGQEKEAEKLLAAMVRHVRGAAEAAAATGIDPATVTVQRWAEEWIDRREKRGVAMVKDERQRLGAYIGPSLGSVRVRELSAQQVRIWVAKLRDQLSSRSVLHVYGTLRQIMRGAVREGIIMASPCVLDREDLPTLQDKDPEWRLGAVFTRDELEVLISHPDIPEERRLGYALMGLAGLRWGEVAALRWRAYDPAATPLGRLTVAVAVSSRRRALARKAGKEEDDGIGRTKTGAVRRAPVHPVLAAMLAAWRLMYPGRPDDLVLPGHAGKPRTASSAYKSMRVDLRNLRLNPRRLHDFRRTFVTLAQADGAAPSVLRWITHTPARSDMIATYSSLPWATLCEAVSCMRIEVRTGQVRELRAAAGAMRPDTPLAHHGAGKGKGPESLRNSGPLLVGATGFEPATTCTPSKCATRLRYAPTAWGPNARVCRRAASPRQG